MMKIVGADAFEVEANIFTVVEYLGGGRSVYHNGTKNFAYFTKDQAEHLANRINDARFIDLAHWDAGRYHRDEFALIEAEYYEG